LKTQLLENRNLTHCTALEITLIKSCVSITLLRVRSISKIWERCNSGTPPSKSTHSGLETLPDFFVAI